MPGDLSILGFDDTTSPAHLWPPLTTVRWPIEAMARAAAAKLLSGTPDENAVAAKPWMFLSELIRRASVDRAR